MKITDYLDYKFLRKIEYSKQSKEWFRKNIFADHRDKASVMNRYGMRPDDEGESVLCEIVVPAEVLARDPSYEDKLDYVLKEAEIKEFKYFIEELGIDGSMLYKEVFNFTNEEGELSNCFGVQYTLQLHYLERSYFVRQVVSWSIVGLIGLGLLSFLTYFLWSLFIH